MRRRDLLGVALTAAALTPFGSRAQQKAMPVIGYLESGSQGPLANSPLSSAAFRRGLGETGYIEGQNVAIEYRGAVGSHYDRLAALAADLVGRKVDLIAAIGNAPALAAKSATSMIPIVFAMG